MWLKFYNFRPENDGEKWSRKDVFEKISIRKDSFGPTGLLHKSKDSCLELQIQ